MTEDEISYALAKQLKPAHSIESNYGHIHLDQELCQAMDAALRPILERRLAQLKQDNGAPADTSAPDTPYNLGWSAGWDAHARAHGGADATAQQSAPMVPYSSAKHWHDKYRAACLARRDDAARYGAQIEALGDAVADDAYAATFQTLGQYRSAILKKARA